jgi:branched-chain amino acid transport system permease protein
VLGDEAVDIFGVRVVPEVLWVLFGSLLIAVVVHRLLNGTRYGTAMRACPQDPEVAALMGINTDRMRSGAFFIGGAIAALGGVLVAPLVVLQPTLGTSLAIPGFIAAVVGGLGSIPGAMIGGLMLGILQASSIFVISPEYKDAVVYVLLVAVLLVRPAGLFRGADPSLREA